MSELKVTDQADRTIKGISAIINKVLCTGTKEKVDIRSSQKLSRSNSLWNQEFKGFNSFERLCFEKTAPGALNTQYHPRKYFPKLSHPGIQRPLQM